VVAAARDDVAAVILALPTTALPDEYVATCLCLSIEGSGLIITESLRVDAYLRRIPSRCGGDGADDDAQY
jgi:hypothetical protein